MVKLRHNDMSDMKTFEKISPYQNYTDISVLSYRESKFYIIYIGISNVGLTVVTRFFTLRALRYDCVIGAVGITKFVLIRNSH
jgi:hypothetical protein